jgi:hypothetical protein
MQNAEGHVQILQIGNWANWRMPLNQVITRMFEYWENYLIPSFPKFQVFMREALALRLDLLESRVQVGNEGIEILGKGINRPNPPNSIQNFPKMASPINPLRDENDGQIHFDGN